METNTISHAAWIAILVIIVPRRGKATLDIKPNNTVVLLNGSTFFNCSTFNFSSNSEQIAWYHSAGNNLRSDVYEEGDILGNYAGRFRVEKDLSKGIVNLIVQAATLEDAGTYECQDGKGFEETARAKLTVLESVPTCTSTKNPIELIGPNSCNKEQENLTLACGVAYRGNSPPLLEWKMAGANDTVTQGVTVERLDNRITSHLTMPSQPYIDGSSFICQTRETKYNCTSDVINVIYVISSDFTQKALIGDIVVCTANTSESCSYRWKWFKGDDILTASNSQTLIPKQSGNFRCEADCIIRNEPCMITAMFAYVEDGNATSTTGETNKAGLIAGVLLAIVAIITIALVVWWCQYKKWKNNENQLIDDKVEVPLEIKPKRDRSSHTDVVDSAVPYDIQKAFDKHPFMSKGLNGEIRGPVQYKDIAVQCAFERIICSTDQRTPANEGQMAKQQKLCSYGKQWMELDHDNLVKFYDVVLKPPALFIVKEYTAGGSVRNALKECSERKVILQMLVVRDWATQIAQGMNYLHEKNIIHNGLKCAQVQIMELFDPSAAAPVTLKISSYNLTSDIDRSNPATFEGMFAWMAPEAILESKYSTYSDIWSYGVTVWEILTTELPYNNFKTGQIMTGISSRTLSLKTPDTCPQDLHDIIEECFDQQPERRPAFSKILTRLPEVH